jgi:RNA-binding protein
VSQPHSITSQQRRWLKQQAHHLKPVVLLGQAGLTDAVLTEIELALDHHELIKVRVNGGDHDERDAQVAAIAQHTKADLVQRIGNVAVYFRANPKRKDGLVLPI